MNKVVVVLFLLCASVVSQAQSHSVSILVRGYTKSTILLVDCAGDRNSIVDSGKTDGLGFAKIALPTYRTFGQYKLIINGNEAIEFLANNEDVVLETDMSDVQKSLVIKQSEENRQYYSWQQNAQIIKTKIELLQQLYDAYPKDDSFVPKIVEEYDGEVANYELISSAGLALKNSFSSKLIAAKREVFPPLTSNAFEREFYARRHFFDYVPFADSQLLVTNAITQRSFDYLMRHTSKQLTKEQTIQILKQAVDTLMRKLQPYPKMYDQVTDYMINGFEGMGAGVLVQHIAERYSSQTSCEGDGKKTTLQRKVLSYTKLNEGAVAPAFSSINENGAVITQNNFTGKTVLLVFWASWCPHCEMLLPEVKALYDKQKVKKFEFVTASLDTNKVMWKNYINMNHFNTSVNLCDGKSWDGKMAQDYLIYATPSVFLIKDGKILARPGSLDDLKAVLKKRLLIE